MHKIFSGLSLELDTIEKTKTSVPSGAKRLLSLFLNKNEILRGTWSQFYECKLRNILPKDPYSVSLCLWQLNGTKNLVLRLSTILLF